MSGEIYLPHDIEDEIKAKGSLNSYLNNFILLLNWNAENSMTQRKMIEMFGEMDMANNQRYPTTDEKEIQNFSELFLSQTPREFFEVIDKVVSTLDLEDSIAKLSEERVALQSLLFAVQLGESNEGFEDVNTAIRKNLVAFNQTILPVYIQMRMNGYNHEELTL